MAPAPMTGPGVSEERRDERAAMVRGLIERVSEVAAETRIQTLSAEVRSALLRVPRHEFVSADAQELAYADTALAIGHGQTISQPLIVALMTELAGVTAGDRVLEIGTGSGYQAAVLSCLARRVSTIEILPELATSAAARLARLGFDNVEVRCADGFSGWPERSPFDVVVVTAATPEPPPPLVAQLADGGRMVLPIGAPSGTQELALLHKRGDGELDVRRVLAVSFVPFTRDESEARRPA